MATWKDTIQNVLNENKGITYGEAMQRAKPIWAESKIARGETPPKPPTRLRGKQVIPAVNKKKQRRRNYCVTASVRPDVFKPRTLLIVKTACVAALRS